MVTFIAVRVFIAGYNPLKNVHLSSKQLINDIFSHDILL